MRKAALFSGLFHIVLLLAVLVSFDWWGDDEREEIISVQIIEFDDLADKPVVEEVAEEIIEPEPELEVEPEPEPDPEPKEPVAELPPPVAEEAPPPVAEPEVIPAPEVAPKAPTRVTKDIPNLRPLDKPKPPSKFDTSRIAALLDKREREETPPPKAEPVKIEKAPQPVKRNQIQQARVTASIQAAIKSQVERCWNAPIGASYAETLIVEIRIFLRPDGTLIGAPKILDESRMNKDSFFRAAAEAARRAVQRCASKDRPLKLPREEYEIWRDVVLKFDPSKVL